MEQAAPAPIFAQLPTVTAAKNINGPDAGLRFGEYTIEVRISISTELLEKLFQVLRHA